MVFGGRCEDSEFIDGDCSPDAFVPNLFMNFILPYYSFSNIHLNFRNIFERSLSYIYVPTLLSILFTRHS
jgi:hypothetical protein